MIPLSATDAAHLRAGEGWLTLKELVEAQRELERIAPEAQNHPQVLQLRWEICITAGHWALSLELARVLCRQYPNQAWPWICLARSLHALGETREGLWVLLHVAMKFPGDSLVPYQIACCQCVIGDLQQSARWLQRALRLTPGPHLAERARTDTDLRPLWPVLDELQS